MDDESKLRLEKIPVTEDHGAAASLECDSFSNINCTLTPALSLVANCSSSTVISQELVDSSQRPPSSVDKQWGSHIVKVITTVGNSGTHRYILTSSSGCTGLNSATTANANSRIPVKFIVAERINNRMKSPVSSPKLIPGTVFRAAQQTVCLSKASAPINSVGKMTTLYPKENLTVIGEPSPKKVAVISIPVKQSVCHTIFGSQQSMGTSATSSFLAVDESPDFIDLVNSPVKIATAAQQKIILQPISLHPVPQTSIRATCPVMLTQEMPRTGPTSSSLIQQLSQSMTASATFTTAGQVKYVKLLTLPSAESSLKMNGNSSALKPAVSPGLQLVVTAGKAIGSPQVAKVASSTSSTSLPLPQVCQVLQTNDWRKSQTTSASQASSSRTSVTATKRTILPSPFKSTYDQSVSAEELKSAVAHMTKQAALTMRDFQRKTGQRKVQNSISRSRKTTDFGSNLSLCEVPTKSRSRVSSSTGSIDGFFGEKSRRPCNCSKSQCLKLYCECFANGEFCSDCNCISCANNLEHEDERQKAIKACLDRNPYAFHPKIGKNREGDVGRQHSKGCHCKRSFCLKNYCECFEAKILCSDLCKCFDCKNYEFSTVRQSLMQLADAADSRVQQQFAATSRLHSDIEYSVQKPAVETNGKRLPHSFMTMDVVEATNSCLLATVEECFVMRLSDEVTERQLLEEFGRCLEQVIDAANRSTGSDQSS